MFGLQSSDNFLTRTDFEILCVCLTSSHVVKFPRPSSSVYWKRSNTGDGEGLAIKLTLSVLVHFTVGVKKQEIKEYRSWL